MTRLLVPVLLSCLWGLLPAPVAHAQEAVAEPLSIEPSGEDYLRAVRLTRIESDVGYFAPGAPPPELSTTERPEAPSDPDETDLPDVGRGPMILIAGAFLAAVLYMFARFGGSVSLSLRQEAGNASRRRDAGTRNGGFAEEARSRTLASILRIGDRRIALVALAQHALAKVIADSGVLLQSSWTARDALRHVPREHAMLAALRDLVLDGERVQFGGRDVSEEDFKAHVQRIGPLFGRGGPA